MQSKQKGLKDKIEISGFELEKTAKQMKLNLQRQLKEQNSAVTVDQWLILDLLQKENGLSQFEICQRLSKDAPTLTRMIDLLCEKKICERRADPKDRRRFNIFLSNKGKKEAAKLEPLVKKFRAQAYQKLSNKDLDHVLSILKTIQQNLNTI